MLQSHAMAKNSNMPIYSVAQLNAMIKGALDSALPGRFLLRGQVSDWKRHSSGHCYFLLKDVESQVSCVMWAGKARSLKFAVENGMEVIATGSLEVYLPRGQYQFYAEKLEPAGVGALQLAFEQMRRRLEAEGLFRPEHKKRIPPFAMRIGVVTSWTGAAIKDIGESIFHRWPCARLSVFDVPVQGEGAAQKIAAAIARANALQGSLGLQILIVGRGGGSMEDLWEFNNEELAYAIRASKVPIVSAVGHEIDITISDLAADMRAPTPSAAAELLVAEKETIEKLLYDIRGRMISSFRYFLDNIKGSLNMIKKGLSDPRKEISNIWLRLDELEGRLKRQASLLLSDRKTGLRNLSRSMFVNSPVKRIERFRETLSFKQQLLTRSMKRVMADKQKGIDILNGKLNDLNPYAILDRGYSITRSSDKKTAIRSATEAKAGDRVNITLSKGSLECLVEKVFEK